MFRNGFASFLHERSGSVAIAYALALLPLIGAAGAAIDYSRATNERAKLQQVTDTAALEAVLMDATSDQQRIEQAKTVVKATKPDAVVSAVVDGATVTVTSKGEVGTLLLQTLGMDRVPLAAKAAATLAMTGPPACVLALNETASPAISFSGNSSFSGKGCAVQSNSRSPTALVVQGSATAKADAFCAVGGYSSNGGASPKPKSNCAPLKDPYASLKAPSIGGCTFSNVDVKPNEKVALLKGTYCNGLELKGTVTLEDGVYVIKDGPLTITSQASVIGKNITFYLTGSEAGFTINGGGKLNIGAPTSGPYGGILIYQDPSSTAGSENTMNGNSDTQLMGLIYTPKQALKVNGNTSFGDQTPLTAIIADTVTFTGSATAKAEVTGITMAAPLPQIQGGAKLIQ